MEYDEDSDSEVLFSYSFTVKDENIKMYKVTEKGAKYFDFLGDSEKMSMEEHIEAERKRNEMTTHLWALQQLLCVMGSKQFEPTKIIETFIYGLKNLHTFNELTKQTAKTFKYAIDNMNDLILDGLQKELLMEVNSI